MNSEVIERITFERIDLVIPFMKNEELAIKYWNTRDNVKIVTK